MDLDEKRSELELEKLQADIDKLDVDTRRSRHGLWLDWHRAIFLTLGGVSAGYALFKTLGWL